jgi:hypothetical protein
MSAPTSGTAPWCPLPITNTRRGYVSSHDTNVAETIRQHAPIMVCPVRGMQDDYETVQQHDWLDAGGFR